MATTIVDTSILSAMARCPTDAGLRYALGLTAMKDSAPMRVGAAAHAVLARYFADLDAAKALAVLEAKYTLWALGEGQVPEGDRLAPTNVRMILDWWLKTHPPASLPFRIAAEHVEVGVSVPLDETGEFVFVGRLDALGQDAAGAWYVIEHKTSGRLGEAWRRRWRTSAQLTGYVWAAAQTLGLPVVGAFVNGIEFARLPSDDKRKCREHGVVYAECGVLHANADITIETRTPQQTAAWRAAAIGLAEQYRDLAARLPDLAALAAVPMSGQFTGTCERCQFAEFCALGRPQAHAASLLRHEPWEPWKHAFGGDEE